MPEFCLHPRSGNDASDGSSWANAWKTINGGATAARIAPGDTIKIAKSAVTSLGSATWTHDSATVTLASAATKNISLCEDATGWTAATNVTLGNNTSYFNQGAKSVSLAAASAFGTGIIGYLDLGSSGLDLSSYDAVCFYLRSTANVSAGVISFKTCSNQDGTGDVDVFDVGALSSSTAHIIVLKKSSGNLGTVKSICFYANSDPGTATFYIDNIFAWSQTTPLHLGTPIGKNDGKWWAVRSIDETTIALGSPFTSSITGKFYGTSESATTYSLDAYELDVAGSGANAINESGTKGNLESYIGGYNTSTDSVDGITWFYGRRDSGLGAITISSDRNYVCLKNFGASFFQGFAYIAAKCNNAVFENLCFSACQRGWFYLLTAYCYACQYSGTWRGTFSYSTAYHITVCDEKASSCFGDADIELYGNTSNAVGLYCAGSLNRFTGTFRMYTLGGIGLVAGEESGNINDVYIANVEIYGVTGTTDAILFYRGQGQVEIGTLTLVDCTSSRNFHMQMGLLRIGNLILSGTAAYSSYFNTTYGIGSSKVFVDRLNADNRWRMDMSSGVVSDQITGGQAAALARGGSGLCLYFNPTSQDYPLLWHCYAPVTAGVAQTLQFYVKKTSSGADSTLAYNVSGCGVDIVQASVSLTDSWALHTSAEFTPTYTGMVRIDFFAYDGSTTGDIGIDDISLVAS